MKASDSDGSDYEEKSELFDRIRDLAARNLISKSELLKAYREGRESEAGVSASGEGIEAPTSNRISRIIYSLGALTIVLGIVLFVFQNWTELSRFAKILVTAGSGTVALLVALVLDYLNLGEIFTRGLYYVSGLVLPLGLFLGYELYGYDPYAPEVVTQVTGVLSLVYVFTYRLFDRTIVLAYSIVFGSWFYFGATEWVFVSEGVTPGVRFAYYRTLFVSVAWMFLANFTARRRRPVLTNVLWGLGNFTFLSAGFALGGWEPGRYMFWELAFPFMVLFILWVSVRVNSRVSLVVSALFLMSYLTRLTMKYFQDSFGWPLALVLLGFGIMSIGSVTYLLYDRLVTSRRTF